MKRTYGPQWNKHVDEAIGNVRELAAFRVLMNEKMINVPAEINTMIVQRIAYYNSNLKVWSKEYQAAQPYDPNWVYADPGRNRLPTHNGAY